MIMMMRCNKKVVFIHTRSIIRETFVADEEGIEMFLHLIRASISIVHGHFFCNETAFALGPSVLGLLSKRLLL